MWALLSSWPRAWVLAAVVPALRMVTRRARTAVARHRESNSPLTAKLGRANSLLTGPQRRRNNRDHRASRGQGGNYRTRGAKGGWL